MEPITNAGLSQDLRRPLTLKIVNCMHPFCRLVAAFALMHWGGSISEAAPAPPGSLSLFDVNSGREVTVLTYAPAPADNPLKGIACNTSVSSARIASFPTSLMMGVLPLRTTVTASNTYSWAPLEALLNTATNSGCQLIPRFYCDWPGQNPSLPQYLLDAGLQTWSYTCEGAPATWPDYNSALMLNCLTNFINAFGAAYDGDPRIAFIEVGTIGPWGEWHWGTDNSMQTNWATLSTQAQVLNAYLAAFTKTKLQFRYPAGTNNDAGGVPTLRNDNLPFGYHDDSFCRTTIGTGNWFMTTELATANATDKWRHFPMGGEFGNDVTQCIFSNPPCISSQGAANQTFTNCVLASHSSYVHCWSVFYQPDSYVFPYALDSARFLGYELYVNGCSVGTNAGQVSANVTITNTGVAPFYYPWTVQVAAAASGSIVSTWSPPWDLTTIVPGQGSQTYSLTLTNPPARPFTLLLRAINPCITGKPLRFANINQSATITNWLTLTRVQ